MTTDRPIPEYASPATLVSHYHEYADAIRSGAVLIHLERASIQVDEAQALEAYRVPTHRPRGNCDVIARRVAVGVVQEMLADADLYVSGTFDWGVVPSRSGPITARALADYLIATRETSPRARAERMSQILSDGQAAADID